MKTLSWDKIQQGDEEAFRQLYTDFLADNAFNHFLFLL